MKDKPGDLEILQWPIPKSFRSLKEVTYRNRFARILQSCSVREALKRYVYHTPEEIEELWEFAKQKIESEISGTGVELGAGCGILSSVAAKKGSIEKIYAVEICDEITTTLLPRVAAEILGDNRHKVIPVVGTFDDIQLPNQSVDFIIEIDSLHHSHDLHNTLAECSRVLKKDGLLICFDRSHADHVTNEQLEKRLDIVYSDKFLEENGYPPGRLTRRQNGEHEHRHHEWLEYFGTAGFELICSQRIRKQLDWRVAAQGAIGTLPYPIRKLLIKNHSIPFAVFLHWMMRTVGIKVNKFGKSILGPTNTTLFIVRRK